MKWLAVVSLVLWGAPQDPNKKEPEKKGLHIATAGLGFLPLVEVPNAVPLTPVDPESKRYLSRLDSWTPLTVVFDNHEEAFSGTLSVRSTWPEDRNPVVYHKRIRIGGKGLSRVSLPVLNNSIWPFRISFDDDKLGSIAIAGAREFEIGRPRTQGVTTRLVLVATTVKSNFIHFLRRNPSRQFLTDRMIVPVELKSLPATALEYQPVDALILDDLPLEELTAAQQAALVEWVCRGGTLITCVARSAARPVPAMLESLLPGTPGPMVNRGDVDELKNATGVACPLDPALAMTTFAPKTGATGWVDDAPVIVHARHELGMTICVGFPISSRFLQTWPASPRLFDLLIEFDRAPQVSMPGTTSLDSLRTSLAKALKGSIAKTLPPFRTVLIVMGIYGAAILLLPYAGFRPFKRLEYAWGLVLVLALAGSGVVYGVGERYLRKNSSVYRVTVVEGGAAEGPHTRHNFWCAFTAKSDAIDLTFDRPSVAYPFGRELTLRGSAIEDAMETWYEPDVHIKRLKTYAQDSVLFETADSETMTGSLEFRAEPSATLDGTLRITLTVRDGFAFKQGWVAWRDRVAEVRPGNSTPEWTMAGIPTVKDPSVVRQRVFEALAAEAVRQSRSLGRPVLLYETHGEAGLEKPALNEEHFHFGYLPAAEPELPARQSEWTMRRLTPVPDADGDADAPVEWILSLITGERLTALSIPDWQNDRYHVEFFNIRSQQWDRIARGYDMRADPYVTYGKLGRAFIRARLLGRGVGLQTEFPKITSR